MKIRTRLSLLFILFIALGIYSLAYWIQGDIKFRYREAQEDTLVDLSRLFASTIETQGIYDSFAPATIDTYFIRRIVDNLKPQEFSAKIYQLDKKKVDVRIYVTDKNGVLIYDSHPRDTGVDYSKWNDVKLTLEGKYGKRTTQGDPLYPAGSTMYVAAPIKYHNEIIGVVSVGKPTENTELFTRYLLNNILYVSLIILLVATVIGLLIHWWMSRPLAKLQQYASALSQGERVTLPRLGKNEVGQAGQAMEEMRVALDGKRYISDYVQALTHELKSPIAAIRGAAELLDEDMPDADRKRFMGNIHNEVVRMQELIDRLLDLASLESRPGLDNIEVIDVESLFNDVIDSMQPIALHDDIEIRSNVEQPLQIQGERFLLTKALTNLVKNAIEFSCAGGQIELSATKQEAKIRLCVTDHGTGIPDYAIDKVCERFYALPKPDGKKGSGLGLSFVSEIAALHQAEFIIDSTPDTGTTACLLFPVV